MLLLILAIGLAVMAVVSLAAIVDPFSWLPTPDAIWGDCHARNCTLEHRFPGFWWHVAANLAWAGAATATLVASYVTAGELRTTRTARFAGPAEFTAYRAAQRSFATAIAPGFALAALPVIVAVA